MAILISIIVPSIVTQSKIKVNNQQHFYYRYQKGVRNTGKNLETTIIVRGFNTSLLTFDISNSQEISVGDILMIINETIPSN